MHVASGVGRWRRTLIALAAAGALAATVAPPRAVARVVPPASDLDIRSAAAIRLAEQAMAVIGQVRAGRGNADKERAAALQTRKVPSARLAFIGAEMTPLVTTVGNLDAKLLATDPRWAGLVVRQLAARGVGPGTAVCASFSGSFPALNLAVIVAAGALDARVIAISSVTASSWGANEPGLTWPEMEAEMVEAGVVKPASVAISLGGTRDSARDLTPEARAVAGRIQEDAARRIGAKVLRTDTLAEAIAARLDAYRQALDGRRPVVYVNVGGNHASLGGASAPLRHDGGWLLAMPEGGTPSDSVLHAYLSDGVPVLSLLDVKALAAGWGLDRDRQRPAGSIHPPGA